MPPSDDISKSNVKPGQGIPPAKVIGRIDPSTAMFKRGYINKEMVLCTMPHRDPGNVPVYTRKNGNFHLTMMAGWDERKQCSIGFPYGTIPRLLFVWIVSQVVEHRQTRIELGNNMSEFLRDVGLDPNTGRGKFGASTRVKEQLRRLMNVRISFAYIDGDDEAGNESKGFLDIPDYYEFHWDFKNPQQGSFFDSYIDLSQKFVDAILQSPVPINMNALRHLKKSPLAIDLYVWVCFRSYTIWEAKSAGVNIPYKQLKWQFGSEYTLDRHFKAALREAMEKVVEVYPNLKHEFTPRGLTLLRSRPAVDSTLSKHMAKIGIHHVPKKKEISDAAKARAKELAPNWDINALAGEWKTWVEKKGYQVRDPDANFIGFVRTHVKSNGP